MREAAVLLVVVIAGCGGRSTSDGAAGAAGRPSCRAVAAGADKYCGAASDVDCCGWSQIPGGTFNRLNNPALPAAVSKFKLDLLEVTVGRFRAFVEAYPASRPKAGDGANPRIPDSGWKSDWDNELPETKAALIAQLRTDESGAACVGWTDDPGPTEKVPMGCLTWYEAFAFCAWDDGRLPTLAEWNFAAAGGNEQRMNPWGNEPYDPSRAVYSDGGMAGDPLAVAGSKAAGAARWGQLDMGGTRFEWGLDTTRVDIKKPSDNDVLPPSCVDCAESSHPEQRLILNLSWHQGPSNDTYPEPWSVVKHVFGAEPPGGWFAPTGVRCVYSR